MKRPIRRQHPPFGEVSAVVEGGYELRMRAEGAVGSLTGFVCSASGLTATLRIAARVSRGGATTYAFAEREPDDDALDVWATLSDAGRETGARVHAHLVRGGGGTEGSIHASAFDVWFPFDATAWDGDLTIEAVWPAYDARGRIEIPGVALRRAAARADTQFLLTD